MTALGEQDHLLLNVANPGSAPEAPLHTFTRLNAERGTGPYEREQVPVGLVAVILGVAVVMLAVAWWVNRSASRRPSAADRAYTRLARRMRLGKQGRAELERIARVTGASPLGLLVSPGALRAALDQAVATDTPDGPGLQRVRSLAG